MDKFKWDDDLVAESLVFWINEKSNMRYKESLKYFKESKQPKILFTTEDGVKKYKGDDCWYWDLHSVKPAKWHSLPDPLRITNTNTDVSKYKFFSTREAAEKYILYNKPCLSINQIIEDCIKKYGHFNDIWLKELTDLAKSTLNL